MTWDEMARTILHCGTYLRTDAAFAQRSLFLRQRLLQVALLTDWRSSQTDGGVPFFRGSGDRSLG